VRELEELLSGAERYRDEGGWFEVIELPNRVYAFWEPGHMEEVNSFLVLGETKDVLYDTGMGIGSIGGAVARLRHRQGRGELPLMVINSHNHLDHNGGNADFEEAWIIEDAWAIAKLTSGLPAGSWKDYWAELTPEGSGAPIEPPDDFDPETFSIPPFPREGIRFLADGDVVDLGDRRFRVLHTVSHSPDGLALYDEENRIFFGGDTFIGDMFLIRDLALLAQDLERAAALDVEWHYGSHGPQLVEVNRSGHHLQIVRRMIKGEGERGETTFAGSEFPLYTLEDISVIHAGDFLTY
jgi:glyoxylase-like metal-dependent hydrolase (beta-lactamase superfamily II)